MEPTGPHCPLEAYRQQMRVLFLMVTASLLLSGCRDDAGPAAVTDAGPPATAAAAAGTETPTITTTVGASRLPVPRVVEGACSYEQRQSVFDVLCPTRLPGVTRGTTVTRGVNLAVVRWPRTRASWYGLSFNAPLRPPRFFHLELLGGYWEGDRPAWSMRAWLGSGSTKRRIGRVRLGGNDGVLYDHPSYSEGGGVFGGHLTFIWRKREITYVASLHTWKPRHEARRALATIVMALRPAPGWRIKPYG